MKEARTVLTARTVSPNRRWSMRVQATSYSKPLIPDRKKNPRRRRRRKFTRGFARGPLPR